MYTYKIRRVPNGKSAAGKPFINFSLTVPPEMAAIIPEGQRFEAVMTDEGLLYRAVSEHDKPELPEWAKANGDGS
jgi:hypothetical protein